MSRVEKILCDRCGKEFEVINNKQLSDKSARIDLYEIGHCIKQVIIGAETGTRKNKVVPKKEWVDNIVKQCDANGIKVFMKESLREIMGKEFRQDQLPWEIKKDG